MPSTLDIQATTRELQPHQIVHARDWIEWTPGYWTRITLGSVYVGMRVEQISGAGGVHKVRRDMED